VVLLTVKNPFISRDIIICARASAFAIIRIYEIKALKTHLFAAEFSLHQITQKLQISSSNNDKY